VCRELTYLLKCSTLYWCIYLWWFITLWALYSNLRRGAQFLCTCVDDVIFTAANHVLGIFSSISHFSNFAFKYGAVSTPAIDTVTEINKTIEIVRNHFIFFTVQKPTHGVSSVTLTTYGQRIVTLSYAFSQKRILFEKYYLKNSKRTFWTPYILIMFVVIVEYTTFVAY
jgi:hypothetical protein